MQLTIVIPVYISTPLHLDFTCQTLDSIQTSHDYQIILINNYCAPEFTIEVNRLAAAHTPGVAVISNPKGNILAAAWNLGITHAFKKAMQASPIGAHRRTPSDVRDPSTTRGFAESPSNYCLLLNNDLILHPKCIDHLVNFAVKHPEFILWSASEWPDHRTLNQAKMTSSHSPHPHFSCFMVSPQTIKAIGYFDENFTMGYFEDNDYHTRILQAGLQAAATDSAKFYHYGSRTVHADDNLKPESKFHYQKNRAYFKKKWGLDIHGRAFDPPEAIITQLKPIVIKSAID